MRKPLFSSNHHFDILICLGLVLAVFVPYHQVAGHRFVEFDDGLYIFQNTYVIRGLNWDSICWAFTNIESGNWQPIAWLSHLVDRELFGPHAGGYLLESVGWHALAVCLCYWAFLRVTGRRFFALVVALFFALHPVNVENVAWYSERKSLLNAVFWFAAIIAYLDFIETLKFRPYGVAVIAFLLSLMSKPMSITLPGTLVLVHALYLVYHPDRRGPSPSLRRYSREVLLPVVPLVLVSAYFTVITILAQTLAMSGPNFTVDLRAINALRSCGRYLVMFFHPTELANFYPLYVSELTLRSAVAPALVVAAISLACILLARRRPVLLIGWAWFLGTLLPVIGLIQVGSQSHADRYLYVPMIGLAFVYPALFEELRMIAVPLRRGLVAMTLAVLTLALTTATQIQVSYWKDGVTLFRHSLAVTGDCVTTVVNLAVAYSRMRRYPEMLAFADAKLAVAKRLENQAKLTSHRAVALCGMGRYEEAIASAQRAIDMGDTEDSSYWVLAFSNYELGRYDQAAKYLPKARGGRSKPAASSWVEGVRGQNWASLEEMLAEKRLPPGDLPATSTGAQINSRGRH